MRWVWLLLGMAAPAVALETTITKSMRLPDGVHRLTEPLRIVADGVTLDLGNAELVGPNGDGDPDGFTGIGILVDGRKGVTIRGGKVRGFKCGILARGCTRLVLAEVEVTHNFAQRLRSTPEREASGDWLWPHENDKQEWRTRYGAGICLERCRSAKILRCRGRRQQNGILLDRCRKCVVSHCDFSFHSGWGIALWRSSHNTVRGCKFDWCVRGYSHGVYDRGQDSAGILVFEQCHHNRFGENSATHSGDGFFLFAGNETLNGTGKGGCNDNVVDGNDFRFAVANAIEATFSTRNTFSNNLCTNSNYGIWAGYSYDCVFRQNVCDTNRYAGIAIEHGEGHEIVDNHFWDNPKGIWLWWDDDKDLLQSAFGKTHPCRSRGYTIKRNRFSSEVGIFLRDTTEVAFVANEFTSGTHLVRKGDCPGVAEPKVVNPERWTYRWRKPPVNVGHPQGRETIVIGEWGPLPFDERAVFPKDAVGWDGCRFMVMGPPTGFTVEGLPRVLSTSRVFRGFKVVTQTPGVHPFAARVVITKTGEAFPISGVVLKASWRLRHWAWTKDPREDAAAWAAMKKTKPLVDKTVDAIDMSWGGGALGEGLPRDRFATRAETTLATPAGKYVLRTISDDGIRVWIDGKLVQEDWTWHAPKEHKTELELAAGKHEMDVEHFEIDGHAVLRFDLRPSR